MLFRENNFDLKDPSIKPPMIAFRKSKIKLQIQD